MRRRIASRACWGSGRVEIQRWYERGHHFSREDRIGADAEGGELSSPFASERQLRAFGGGVGGGSSLAGERDFGADVHD